MNGTGVFEGDIHRRINEIILFGYVEMLRYIYTLCGFRVCSNTLRHCYKDFTFFASVYIMIHFFNKSISVNKSSRQ